jgi:hypothetical protein
MSERDESLSFFQFSISETEALREQIAFLAQQKGNKGSPFPKKVGRAKFSLRIQRVSKGKQIKPV